MGTVLSVTSMRLHETPDVVTLEYIGHTKKWDRSRRFSQRTWGKSKFVSIMPAMSLWLLGTNSCNGRRDKFKNQYPSHSSRLSCLTTGFVCHIRVWHFSSQAASIVSFSFSVLFCNINNIITVTRQRYKRLSLFQVRHNLPAAGERNMSQNEVHDTIRHRRRTVSFLFLILVMMMVKILTGIRVCFLPSCCLYSLSLLDSSPLSSFIQLVFGWKNRFFPRKNPRKNCLEKNSVKSTFLFPTFRSGEQIRILKKMMSTAQFLFHMKKE